MKKQICIGALALSLMATPIFADETKTENIKEQIILEPVDEKYQWIQEKPTSLDEVKPSYSGSV